MRINSITPDGKIPVSPCVYMHDYRVGDLLTDDIFDIVNSEQFNSFKIRKENYEKIEGCKDCDKAEICRGECFAMAYTYKNVKQVKRICMQEIHSALKKLILMIILNIKREKSN